MDLYKGPFLAVAIIILLSPFGFYLKQFALLDTAQGVSVEFNPMQCFACPDCPCEYQLDESNVFILGSNDKSLCKIPYEYVQDGIERKLDYMKIKLEPERYQNLYDCVSWHSNHPAFF